MRRPHFLLRPRTWGWTAGGAALACFVWMLMIEGDGTHRRTRWNDPPPARGYDVADEWSDGERHERWAAIALLGGFLGLIAGFMTDPHALRRGRD